MTSSGESGSSGASWGTAFTKAPLQPSFFGVVQHIPLDARFHP
jgi:hypothetical protein